MKPITLPGIDEYAEAHTTPDPAFMRLVSENTWQSLSDPQMISGPPQARFLQMLVYALRPRQVLEIGTFSGYSALAMAAALPPDGHVLTCEIDGRHAAMARDHIASSPYAGRITVEVGPALETLDRLPGPFDFVFMDAAKQEYLACLEAVLPKLSDHAMIAADNTLWNGEVLYDDGDADVVALRAFNDAVVADPRLECVLVTLRDGVTLIRRAAR
ncbi:O-methyltransferase [Nonomuraea basaltis]|uniref:O-methyltransferase n=1 Tax=Nonomuraea basaltis TaxID=2495887 RepID=UPI00110C4F67|nr:class I SAM-dependent methyltransferase [Nonomuraea basaltis]TMR90390.1 O-methyltransferase [Nonomuraea basaltis]